MRETERVYRQLKDELLTGTLKPGMPLRQVDIASRTGASRTPVREAIIMLAADRLVRVDSGSGATVREIPVRDFIEINQVRELLECAAARAAASRVPQETIDELVQESRTLTSAAGSRDTVTIAEFDQKLHRTLALHCGNSQMQRLIEEFNALNALARLRDIKARDEEMVQSLVEMIDALASRDADLLESLMRAHIRDFSKVLTSLLRD